MVDIFKIPVVYCYPYDLKGNEEKPMTYKLHFEDLYESICCS